MNEKQLEMLRARHSVLCLMGYAMERAWAGENMPRHVGESHDRITAEAQEIQDLLDAEREPWRGEE
jgi:hypothetical protein